MGWGRGQKQRDREQWAGVGREGEREAKPKGGQRTKKVTDRQEQGGSGDRKSEREQRWGDVDAGSGEEKTGRDTGTRRETETPRDRGRDRNGERVPKNRKGINRRREQEKRRDRIQTHQEWKGTMTELQGRMQQEAAPLGPLASPPEARKDFIWPVSPRTLPRVTQL